MSTSAFWVVVLLALFVGIMIGLWWAGRDIKKSKKNIPEDIIDKEVKSSGSKKENSEEETNTTNADKGRPRGFVGPDGRSLGLRESEDREPEFEDTNVNSPRTDGHEERRNLPIQSISKNRKVRRKPKQDWPSFD